MNYEFEMMAKEAQAHLLKYPASICEMRIEEENIESAKKIVAAIVGSDLIKRINFFPKYK